MANVSCLTPPAGNDNENDHDNTYDNDNDEYYDFEDCDDLNSEINPNSIEIWNGLDDDCNELIDDNLKRENLVLVIPRTQVIYNWDAVNESLIFGLNNIPSQVNTEISWRIGDYDLSENLSNQNTRLVIDELECSKNKDNLTLLLCTNGTSRQLITATIVDSGVSTEFIWELDMIVWIPPPTLFDNLVSFLTSGLGILLLSMIMMSILSAGVFVNYRIKQKRLLEEAYTSYNIPSNKVEYEYSFTKTELPSAPDLSLLEMQNKAYEESIPNLPSTIPMLTIPSKKIDDEVELLDLPSRIIEE